MPSITQQEIPVSVIICHHRNPNLIDRTLGALFQSTYRPSEVIVVDNASRDGSVDCIERKYPSVTLLKSEANLGFVRGNIFAYNSIDRKRHKYIWLLNNDTEVDCQCLEYLYKTMEGDRQIAAVQPKVLSLEAIGHFDYAGGAGGYIDAYGFPFARGRILTQLELDSGQYDRAASIFWASGASILLRTKAVEEIGFFDEEFGAVSEEVDLSWRLLLSGYQIVCQPKAVTHHVGGFTPKRMSANNMYLRHRNSIMTMLRNHSTSSLLQFLPGRIALEVLAFGYAIAQGNFSYAFAVIRSAVWLIANMSLILGRRQRIQKNRRVSDHDLQHLIYPGSIALTYFIGGKRRFSDLQWSKRNEQVTQYPQPVTVTIGIGNQQT